MFSFISQQQYCWQSNQQYTKSDLRLKKVCKLYYENSVQANESFNRN